mgnify:CR=1 FL=1
MYWSWDYPIKIGVALVLGGAIGLDRELHDKPAGLRTNMLVCLAAAIYVNTNRFFEGTVSGDFDDVENLKDYSWEVETTEAMTNGLLQADVWLSRRGMSKPVDRLRILVFDPNFRASPIGPRPPR